MKELTPPEVVQALLDGKKVEIRAVIDSQNSDWKPLDEHEVSIRVLTNGFFMFRLAQEMITVGDVSFPKPESEPLQDGDKYWIADPMANSYAILSMWVGNKLDKLALSKGLLHKSRESAIAHAKAIIKLSGGSIDAE